MKSKSKMIKVYRWGLVQLAVVLMMVSLRPAGAQAPPALPDFDYNFETLVNNQSIFGQDQWVNNQPGAVPVRTGPGVNQTQTAKGEGGSLATGAIRPLDHPFYYTTKDTNVAWGVWGYVPTNCCNKTAIAGISPVYFGPHQLGGVMLTTTLLRVTSPRQLYGDVLLHDHWYEYRVIVDFSIYGGSATLSYRDVTGGATVFTIDSVIHDVNLGLVPDASGRYGFFDVLIRNDGAGYVDNLHFDAPAPTAGACVTPPSGLKGWWPLDETTGTTAADIIGGHNGTALPGPIGAFAGPGPVTSAFWPPPTFPVGMVNNSLFFSGQRRIQVPSHSDLEPGTGDFTIDAWVIYAASGNGQLLNVAQKNTGATAPFGNTFDGWRLVVRDSSPSQGLVSFRGSLSVGGSVEEPITPNAWHHVTATLSTTSGFRIVKVYVDGVSLSQVGLNGDITSTAPMLIGGDGIDAGQIAVDELEIFNRALAQPEIQAIFNAGSAGKCKGCATPPPNMVGWWPADGNATDITPSPDNGTLNGGATFASGEVAQAFSLNGTTAYVSAPDASKLNFGTGDFSIDAWIKTSSNTGVHAIVDKRVGNNATTFTGYHLFTFNGNLAVQLADGTFFNFISTTNVADGAFHHVAVTVVRNSATGGNLYVDGVPVFNFNPTGRPGSLTNNAELRIGRNCPNTVLDTFFNGLIDEVELFNRALSAAEVQGIFKAGSQGKCKCTITCPPNITVSNDLNQCGAVVTYPAPTASAGCGTVTCSPPSGSFFPVGTTTVTCSTTAGPGCTFTVTVNDTQPPSITCPPNITARTAAINDPCVVVSFAPVAIDNCPGVTKVCSPPSMSCFPVGTTTVTCTATDASGNTATCSFTVTVFNVCLQDDSNPSIVFLGNTITGAYRFCCGGTNFTGVAQVTKKGSIATFQHNGPDRRVTATIDGAAFKGSASLQSPPGTTICTITDRDTRNNNCVCQ